MLLFLQEILGHLLLCKENSCPFITSCFTDSSQLTLCQDTFAYAQPSCSVHYYKTGCQSVALFKWNTSRAYVSCSSFSLSFSLFSLFFLCNCCVYKDDLWLLNASLAPHSKFFIIFPVSICIYNSCGHMWHDNSTYYLRNCKVFTRACISTL